MTAVVHTHAVGAVAFASLDVPLRAVSHEAIFFLDPDGPRLLKTSDLIITDELGAAWPKLSGVPPECSSRVTA